MSSFFHYVLIHQAICQEFLSFGHIVKEEIINTNCTGSSTSSVCISFFLGAYRRFSLLPELQREVWGGGGGGIFFLGTIRGFLLLPELQREVCSGVGVGGEGVGVLFLSGYN